MLREFPEVVAIVLGGSHARGMAVANSDIDLGVFYSDEGGLPIARLRQRVAEIPFTSIIAFTELYEWGPWVNGGAWLDVEGERVDLIYRSIDHVHRVIDGAEHGDFELHFGQQPPFGYFGPTYLGEVQIAIPLYDPGHRIAEAKQRVIEYPERLREEIVQRYLWSCEFAFDAFAEKYADREEVFLTTSTIARCVHALTLVLFALNRRHLVNDKTALAETSDFELAPKGYRSRVEALMAQPGASPAALRTSVAKCRELFREVRQLAGVLYASPASP